MLRYEKFQEKHIKTYYSWRNNPEVAQYDQNSFLRPMSFSEVEAWCERMITGLTFVVYDDEQAIGTCAFMNHDSRNRHAELAIVIGEPAYWGKGYGKEIMKQLCNWGFDGLNLQRLYLHVFDFNKRAIRLYESFNFKHEGTLRNMIYRDGRYHDLLAYGLLREEYKEQ